MRMTNGKYLPFVFCMLLFSLPSFLIAQVSIATEVRGKISQVENSLSPLVLAPGAELWNLEDQMRKYHVPGLSIAVINNYEVEWIKAYGFANGKTQTKTTTNTVFQAASMSKFINAMALMKLKETKDFSLDEDVNHLLESWKVPYDPAISDQAITLRQLLSHTAGLSMSGFGGYKMGQKLPSLVQILDGKKPANSESVRPILPPNQNFKYSGGGTIISQLLLMDLTKETYEDYVNEQIFQPLKMNHSFYSTEFDRYPEDIALGHLHSDKPLKYKYRIYPESAAGGLWTTPHDLAIALLDLQLSLSQQRAAVLASKSAVELSTPVDSGISALGVFVEDQAGHTYLQHSGATRAFRSQFYISAEEGKGVVIMHNGANLEILEEIIRSVASVYQWPGFKKMKATVTTLTAAELKPFIGTYQMGKRQILVSHKKGKLQLAEKGKWGATLKPLTPTSFITTRINPPATIEFIKENGKVVQLKMDQGGIYEWVKVK